MTLRARPTARRGRGRARALVALLLILAAPFLLGQSASAQVAQPPPAPAAPPAPTSPAGQTGEADQLDDGSVRIDLDLGDLADPDSKGEGSNTIVVLVGLTVLAIAPALVVMMTSFTRMAVVLGIARNAVGMQTIPPNQVLTGLAIFLSLFVMAPTIEQINDVAWQPYQRGEITQREALKEAEGPIKTFMLANTRREELNLMLDLSKSERPETPEDTSLMALIPAFVLSELKSAFIIGVMVLLPFLVIDLVVSSGLMSLGMMMLPPVFVSLPFKLLLFVMVDGWAMIAHALVANYH